jgi:hypothetical protein
MATETVLLYELKEPVSAWLLCADKAIQIKVHALFCGYDEFVLFDAGGVGDHRTRRGPVRVWGGFSVLPNVLLSDDLPLYSSVNECYLVLPDIIVTGVRFVKEEEGTLGFVGVSMSGPTIIPQVPVYKVET